MPTGMAVQGSGVVVLSLTEAFFEILVRDNTHESCGGLMILPAYYRHSEEHTLITSKGKRRHQH
jgi:hypothetical protein